MEAPDTAWTSRTGRRAGKQLQEAVNRMKGIHRDKGGNRYDDGRKDPILQEAQQASRL